ncbi:hypothetical protein GCM10010112_40400 [Actinoplanes lobatus]|uniref:Uncharacterized protein n=1 Tax=Actinoplanes lobatus TaxID=113568 RepID=A0A7W7MKU0_9ACTN|nr:hypothetical protein [Actinoplanes lobatus]MBB4753843.1 hypothetical protein [Actinoplanes lobatus]GGN72283.1 hypothetical protein GCM10010112_40400 [Actinoplanes lobatus]GIE42003.1 hypothetical protein Alo02nite_49010 [Actinoplanes lobatus]
MGSRANVAIRMDGAWTHCGSDSIGYSLDAYLALGPEPALAVFGAMPAWDDPAQWQTESVCEAGALIDLDAQELLFFLDVDYHQRLALLDGCRRTWPGWTIRWAYNGIADVTDALGLDRAVLGRQPWDNTALFKWHKPGPEEELVLHHVITVGTTAYGLDYNAEAPWSIGPALLDQLFELPRVTTLPRVPRSGLHLDPAARTAGVWSTEPVYGLTERFADRWPGWTLRFWEDRYLEQQRRCGNGFTFADPADLAGASAQALVDRVLRHWVPATTVPGGGPQDPYRGQRDAGLTVDDLQPLTDALLGPSRAPVDVAAYAKAMLD